MRISGFWRGCSGSCDEYERWGGDESNYVEFMPVNPAMQTIKIVSIAVSEPAGFHAGPSKTKGDRKMGYLAGTTASSGARIKEGKEREVEKLMDKYDFSSDLNCQIDNGNIAIWGDAWPYLQLESEKDNECTGYDDHFEEFLEELVPFLAEDLIIHAIGAEGYVFPLEAMEIKVSRRGVVIRDRFKWTL
jgi:hypothetical protein